MNKPLVWKQRCRKDQTAVADRKIWGSKCGKYRVTFSHIRYGENAEKKWADKWFAEELDNNCWEIISEHKKKETAQKACEKKHKQKEKDAAALERLEKRKRKKRAQKTASRTSKRTGKRRKPTKKPTGSAK